MKYYWSWMGMWVTLLTLDLAGAISLNLVTPLGLVLFLSYVLVSYLNWNEFMNKHMEEHAFLVETEAGIERMEQIAIVQDGLIVDQKEALKKQQLLLIEVRASNERLLEDNKALLALVKKSTDLLKNYQKERDTHHGSL